MCGIFGFTGTPSRPTLQKMGDVITHRGPDDVGYWNDEAISMGLTRLSIIDLETGQQPVSNESGHFTSVFNGEIYNHLELRADLEKSGHRFKSHHSDSEVIPHLFEAHGISFVENLRGMFAIALWDRSKRELHLIRDHSGIKPLFYSITTQRNLVFGSEIKALLVHPEIRQAPNFPALHHYFTFKNVPAPWSAFEGIEQLHPGERLVFQRGEIKKTRWWQIRFVEGVATDESSAIQRVRSLLEESVRLQMRSDVPFGAYLSGGVDSSTVVALMSQTSGKRVRTFTLAYEDDFKNKSADRIAAKKVADLYSTEHHEYVMSHREIAESIDAIAGSFDEPFSGVASTFFLTRLISKHVKVALSGDGADELFGSYLPHRLAGPLFHFPKLRDHWDRLSEDEKTLVRPYLEKPGILSEIWARGDEADRRMGQYVWDDSEKESLYSDLMKDRVRGVKSATLVREFFATITTQDPLNRALHLDFVTLLPDQVLAFVDRLSMVHSVEVRPPFLDHKLIEFVATLPGNFKIKNGREKHILKEAVKDLLPADLVDRPKEGFVLPVNDWIAQDLKPYAFELLSPQRLSQHGLFKADFVGKLLEDHYTGGKNFANKIWNLMMFQVWWEKYF